MPSKKNFNILSFLVSFGLIAYFAYIGYLKDFKKNGSSSLPTQASLTFPSTEDFKESTDNQINKDVKKNNLGSNKYLNEQGSIFVGDQKFIGSEKKDVVVLEFTNLECPDCLKTMSTYTNIYKDFISNNKISYLKKYIQVKEDSITQIFSNALHCLNSLKLDNKKTTNLSNLIYSTNNFSASIITEKLVEQKKDSDTYDLCVTNLEKKNMITQDHTFGGKIFVKEVPTFFIGKVKDNYFSGNKILDPTNYKNIKTTLNQLLNK